jgi:hypothetical protein
MLLRRPNASRPSFAVVPIPDTVSGVVPFPTMGVCEPGDRP